MRPFSRYSVSQLSHRNVPFFLQDGKPVVLLNSLKIFCKFLQIYGPPHLSSHQIWQRNGGHMDTFDRIRSNPRLKMQILSSGRFTAERSVHRIARSHSMSGRLLSNVLVRPPSPSLFPDHFGHIHAVDLDPLWIRPVEGVARVHLVWGEDPVIPDVMRHDEPTSRRDNVWAKSSKPDRLSASWLWQTP
jgi:hypothetical protein